MSFSRLRPPLVMLVVSDRVVRQLVHVTLDGRPIVVIEAIGPKQALSRIEGGLEFCAVVTDQPVLVDALVERGPEVAAILLGDHERAPTWSSERVLIVADLALLSTALATGLARLAVPWAIDETLTAHVVVTPLTDDEFRRRAWAAIIEAQEQLVAGKALLAAVEEKLRGRYPLAAVRMRRMPPPMNAERRIVWFCDRDGEVVRDSSGRMSRA